MPSDDDLTAETFEEYLARRREEEKRRMEDEKRRAP